MFHTRKSEVARSQWPFHAWQARRSSAVIDWGDAVGKRGSVPRRATPWALALPMLGMLAVFILAGVMIARLHADEVAADEEPAASQYSLEAIDTHLDALEAEHIRALRGY